MLIAYVVWLLVPFAIWADGRLGGGELNTGPCLSADFRARASAELSVAPGDVVVQSGDEAWPPASTRCTATSPDGEELSEQFPGNGAYLASVVLALAPLALIRGRRRPAGRLSPSA